ncbi:MAG: PEGA domain-containing protein [Polyangiales bacterium]
MEAGPILTLRRGVHRRLSSRITQIAIVLAATVASSAAFADDAAEARLHFELGTARYQAHAFEEALSHFLQAHRLAPTTNTVFNVAQTYSVLHREAEAYRFFSDFLARPDGQPAARSLAERTLAELAPRLARIEVTTTPTGATLYLDRTELGDFGVSPRVLAVSPGPHDVIVRRDGYHEQRQRVEVARGQQVAVTLTLDAVVGSLRIATTPVGAAVEVDGQAVQGNTPLEVTLPAGAHHVRLRRAGYLDVLRDVTLPEAGASLDERLPRDLAAASVLSVASTPPGASVIVRGERVGGAPFTGDLNAGGATVRVEMPGRTPWSREVNLRPGRALDLRVSLGDPTAHRPRWIPVLTFGGAAVAVSGLVLGGFALAAHADFDQAPDRATLDRTNALNLAADVTTGVGLAMVTAGVISWLLSADPTVSRAIVREEGLHDAR